jgi:nitrogen fixation NifU-like protein
VHDDLRELYQQVILDHQRSPRNFRSISNPAKSADGFNALCGDRIHVELAFDAEGRLEDVAFTGTGCAICTASASLMTDSLKGKRPEEAEALFEGFHRLLTTDDPAGDTNSALGKLAVFSGVREFPVRVKCATLPWHTFHAALHGQDEPVSTE